MRCPECGQPGGEVLDSRPNANGREIRRRRQCALGHRYTTHETVVDERAIQARKRDVSHLLRQLVRAVRRL